MGRFFALRRAEGEALTALYTSHLKRSAQTAHAIAEATGLTPRRESALAESHLGAWEGLTPEEIDAQFEGAYQRWYHRPSQVEIPGAEPLGAFTRRVRDAFERIRSAENGREGSVVIVTHGGVIASWLAGWLKSDYDEVLRRVVLSNAGISAIEYGNSLPSILWINSTRHLTD